MKYSILMPYFDRAKQLHRTFQSFVKYYVQRDDWEVIIMIDEKTGIEDEIYLSEELIPESIKRRVFRFPSPFDGQLTMSPCRLYNEMAHATGEFLVLTNPECFHRDNVLAKFDKVLSNHENTKENFYIITACLHVEEIRDGKAHGKTRWYQHSVYRPSDYHFCSCISRKAFKHVGGFDECFGEGIGYDDNDFRDNLISNGLSFVRIDDCVVFHQRHDKYRPHNYHELLRRNRKLYLEKSKSRGIIPREN